MVEPEYESLEKLESYPRPPYSVCAGEVPVLVHYTGLNSVFGIVDKKKLWASHISYMNDPNDGYELYNFVLYHIRRRLLLSRFSEKISVIDFIFSTDNFIRVEEFSDLNRLLSDIDHEEFLFDLYVAMLSHRQMRNYFSNKDLSFYIFSFSKFKEDISIDPWRSYAKDAKGFRLEFDFDKLKKSILSSFLINDEKDFVNFYECEYWPFSKFADGANEIIDGFLNIFNVERFRVDKLNIYYRLMVAVENLSLIIKSNSYESECEVRLLIRKKGKKDVCYRPGESLIIPYVECDFDIEALRRVVCGPRTPSRANYSIINFLSSCSGGHVDVRRSPESYVGPY
ncbi:DUF2971 domain-containing protein [Elstera cyanobacteriorum]|uniref:DUF2971 domain-containing protein n=1 Tax=Elstera cyanobacteriorum TaxID=2022747 RepID=UPI002355AD46|nr:DUF2971 domain-containing protein [Elstera cyanobacteriorum]MCK6444546.1 DUF2971 domain-containing protein [Elstera cyanobacteriorum]